MSQLRDRYQKEIMPELKNELGLDNIMAAPRIKKIIVNVGVPRSDTSKKEIPVVVDEIKQITGQTPKISRAKKSIAGFKLREGDPIGVTVTLRGARMFDFLDKLCRIVLPQVKDFRGVKQSAFDGQGNYTLGLTEQIIFPEIDYAKVDKIRGLEITIVTSAINDDHARSLLTKIGMLFEKIESKE